MSTHPLRGACQSLFRFTWAVGAVCILSACAGGDESSRDASPFDPDSPASLKGLFDPEGPRSLSGLPGLPEGLDYGEHTTAEAATTDDATTGTVGQAIVNGALVVDPAPTHGIVDLWAWAGTYDGIPVNEYRQICTGTMITNSVVLTARHCLEEEQLDYSLTIFTLGAEARFAIDGVAAPNDVDAALIALHAPLTIGGSTSGFARPAAPGQPGFTAVAMGYGTTLASGSNLPSAICNSGTQGCDGDRRKLRFSWHSTQWDSGRLQDQLFVTPNMNGQVPTFGDSGGPLLLPQSGPVHHFSVIGVASATYWDQNGVQFTHFAPMQDFDDMLCQFADC